MRQISIIIRSPNKTGTTTLRFRLRDGRAVDLYHKSEIVATMDELNCFDLSTTKVKPRRTIYNKNLERDINIEVAIIDAAYNKMIEDGMPITSGELEHTIYTIRNPSVTNVKSQLLEERFQQFIQDGLRDNLFGESRAKVYYVLLAEIHRFLIIKGYNNIEIRDVTIDTIMHLREFIKDEYQYVTTWKFLYNEMRVQNRPTKPRSGNTIATRVKMLQTFFAELENNEEIDKSPFRKLGKERKRKIMQEKFMEPISLKATELQTIMNASLPKSLQEVRKAFILQCAFGCRISDFKNLQMKNISVSEEGIPYIHYLPIKTRNTQTNNAEIETPIVRFALDIIKDTNFHFGITAYPSGKSGYNVKIRELLKVCEINRLCKQYNEQTEQNDYIPLYEFGSSKLARKTHIDMMSKVQVNLYVSGLHKVGSDAVNHYTNMTLQDRFQLMSVAFQQPLYRVDSELNVILD